MTLLTKEQILGADDLKTKDVHVPQWGGSVRIRIMTASERDQFEQIVFSGKDNRYEHIRALLLALRIVDENGKRMFTVKDVEALGAKSAEAVDVIFAEAQTLNALSDKDVSEMGENLSETPGAGDGGKSP